MINEYDIEREKNLGKIILKIEELKKKLKDIDYKTIKYTQGDLSDEEFEKVKEVCKNYRNEINSLENMLKNS